MILPGRKPRPAASDRFEKLMLERTPNRQSAPIVPDGHQCPPNAPFPDDKGAKDSPAVSVCSHVETTPSHPDDVENQAAHSSASLSSIEDTEAVV